MSKENREKQFADTKRPVTTNRIVTHTMTIGEFLRDQTYWRKRGLTEPLIIQFSDSVETTKYVSNAAYKLAISGDQNQNG